MLDFLIPTYRRDAALAVTLTSLAMQDYRELEVVISDQNSDHDVRNTGEVRAAIRVLELHGQDVRVLKHLPRRGMAEQRQFLLDRARAPYVLFIDDDLILEPDVVRRMLRAIERQGCGFVGCPVIGLSYADDVRPAEQRIEFWDDGCGAADADHCLPGDALEHRRRSGGEARREKGGRIGYFSLMAVHGLWGKCDADESDQSAGAAERAVS